MKVSPLINSFTAGELSPRMASRVDTTKYKSGAQTIHNFIVMAHGGLRKRGGSQFIAPVKSGATPVITDFQYNTEQVYLLEIGYASSAGYIRFFTNGGILTDTSTAITGATKANPCVITATSHGLSNGNWVLITGMTGGMTQLNNRHFLVAGVTANTFQLSGVNSSAYDTFSAGGTVKRIYEVATPYGSGEHDTLSFTQSADVLYIAHKDYPLKKLVRSAATSWALSDVAFENGPFRSINTDADNKISVALTSVVVNISAATKASPCVITTAAHGLSDGATVDIASVSGMTQLNGNTYSVRVLSTTTLALYDELGVPIDSSAYTTYTSGGTVTQADSRFGTYPPGSLVTLTATKATFNADMVTARWRLWEPGKGTGVATAVYQSGVNNLSSNGKVTNDGKVYGVANNSISYWHFDWTQPKHDKGVVRIFDATGASYHDSVFLHDSSCDLIITAYASTTSVTARVVKNHIPNSVVTNKTAIWEEGAWSPHRGYPGFITGHEQRLWTAGSPGDPQTIWASMAGKFEDFQDGANDDRALIYRIQSDKVEAPVWISPGKILMMGTASGEFSITASGRDEAITPSNVRIVKQTTWGSAPGRVQRIGAASLFLQRDGDPTNKARKVREFYYNFDSDSFVAADMTILSEHFGDSRFVNATFQQDPDPIIWLHREDGSFVGLTYEKEQQVVAWHRHNLAGDSAQVEQMRALPGDSGDEVWMIVEREIDGVAVRYHEVLTSDRISTTDKADSRYLDCHLTYDGSETSTVSGLWHLEGETVQVLADGAVHPSVTVAAGKITLNRSASVIHIGYSYTAVLETMDLDAGAQAGTSVGAPKRIVRAKTRFYRTLGGKVGRDGTMDQIPWRKASDPMDASPPLFTGFKNVDFPAGWEQDAIVRIEHDQPLPCNVLSVTVPMSTTG